MKLINVLTLAVCTFLVSCVGTVDDADPVLTKGVDSAILVKSFQGIYDATSISDTKVEIFFYPAAGEAKDITYTVSYDGSSNVKTVQGTSLRPDYRGLLKYTYNGLKVDTAYYFRVQAKDNISGAKSHSNEYRKVSTFLNVTADFNGIASVKNLAGYDGLNSVKVAWPEAVTLGTDYSPNEIDVKEYILTVIEADQLSPSDFDNEAYSDPIRKEYHISPSKVSVIANGLKSATRYYARLRAIHKGYFDNSANPYYKKEENSDYVEFSTLTSDLAAIGVDLDNVKVIRVNETGKNALDISWEMVPGAIDHYRLYYNRPDLGTFELYKSSTDTSCSGKETNDPNFYCMKIPYSVSQTRIVDLEPFVEYEVNVLICQDPSCNKFLQFDRQTGKTDLDIANFNGITSIESARSISELDAVYLKYTSPDLSSGNIDGIIVEAKQRLTGAPLVDTMLNNPDIPNTTSIRSSSFSFLIDDEVKITGIDYNTSEPYCFSMYPYMWQNGVLTMYREAEVVKCILPNLSMPSADEFPGIANVISDPTTNFTTISWNPPQLGIYTHYAIFLKLTPGFFNFGDAVAGNADYMKFIVPSWQLNYIFTLPAGNYSVGVLSYCDLTSTYSDFNSSSVNFTVN